MNIAMLLTFRLIGFGINGGGILLDPSIQNPKLIAVWTKLEPLPLVVNSPAPIILGLILFGIGHAYVYQWIAPFWPEGIKARALRMAALVFFLSFLFWEFFTPFQPVWRALAVDWIGTNILGNYCTGRGFCHCSGD